MSEICFVATWKWALCCRQGAMSPACPRFAKNISGMFFAAFGEGIFAKEDIVFADPDGMKLLLLWYFLFVPE